MKTKYCPAPGDDWAVATVTDGERIARREIDGYYASHSGCIATANTRQEKAAGVQAYLEKTPALEGRYFKFAKVRCEPITVNP
jgi:hypothetical protein